MSDIKPAIKHIATHTNTTHRHRIEEDSRASQCVTVTLRVEPVPIAKMFRGALLMNPLGARSIAASASSADSHADIMLFIDPVVSLHSVIKCHVMRCNDNGQVKKC